MSFIFTNTISDKVKGQTHEQSSHSIHGMTPNGNYFFFNLVYNKTSPRSEISILKLLKLIDTYAETIKHQERVDLKKQIIQAYSGQVDGIALLFSSASETYGFVTGSRVKVARFREESPLEIDADGLFSDSQCYPSLSFGHFVFIFENELEYDYSRLIKPYIQLEADVQAEKIPKGLTAIKYINASQDTVRDLGLYLKNTYNNIQDSTFKHQVQLVESALQLLSISDQLEATTLTLQLLHCQEKDKQKKLLAKYTQLAYQLYVSAVPIDMIVGSSLFLLIASFLLINPSLTLSFSLLLIPSFIIALIGGIDFFNDHNKNKRQAAHALFTFQNKFHTKINAV